MTTTETLGGLIHEYGGSIKTGPFGTALKANEYSTTGVPIISVGEVGYGSLNLRRDTPCAPAEVTQRLPEYLLATGDIVFGRKGAVDRSAWVKRSEEGWFLGSDGIRVRLPSTVDSRYVGYQFQSEATKAWLLQHASGSTMLSLNQKILERVPLQLPPLDQQRAIAEVLGALDDKIAANTKLAGAAMDLAESLYAEGTESSDLQLHELCQISQTVLGGTPSRDNPGYWSHGTIAWLNSGKANEDRILRPSEYITQEALARSSAKLMPVGSTVIAITGATLGQVARLEIEACGNQSLVGIWSEDPATNDWLYFAIRSEIPQLLKKATGAAQQHVNKRDVDSLLIPVPRDVGLKSFALRVRPLLETATAADTENISLAGTRDALLPQLMSGKLRVKDAEKALEDAGV